MIPLLSFLAKSTAEVGHLPKREGEEYLCSDKESPLDFDVCTV